MSHLEISKVILVCCKNNIMNKLNINKVQEFCLQFLGQVLETAHWKTSSSKGIHMHLKQLEKKHSKKQQERLMIQIGKEIAEKYENYE